MFLGGWGMMIYVGYLFMTFWILVSYIDDDSPTIWHSTGASILWFISALLITHVMI